MSTGFLMKKFEMLLFIITKLFSGEKKREVKRERKRSYKEFMKPKPF